jgi:hypothetical protein
MDIYYYLPYDIYYPTLVCSSVICCALVYQGYAVNTKNASTNPRLAYFKRTYLIAYSLVMTSDWLLGAYGYSLYKSYGLSLDTIAGLFIIGYLSSAVFGILDFVN